MDKSFFIAVFTIAAFASIPLEDVYDSAQPRLGFDKYLELDPIEIYTGGLHFISEVTAIVSHGAVIDLEGGEGFTVDGYGTEILFEGITITNYPDDAGLYIANGAHVTIKNCNFYNGQTGISIWDYSLVEIINCNIGNHSYHGVDRAMVGPTVFTEYVNTWENAEGDWRQNCLT